jgi:hypothetical protein
MELTGALKDRQVPGRWLSLARLSRPLTRPIGTTGTGKSTATREILAVALARGDRAVIADPDGHYMEQFYDATRGDVTMPANHTPLRGHAIRMIQ